MVALKFGSLTIFFTMAKYKSRFKAHNGRFELKAGQNSFSNSIKTCKHNGDVPLQFFHEKYADFLVFYDCFFSALSPYQVRTKAA
jgi:hypothetical protein